MGVNRSLREVDVSCVLYLYGGGGRLLGVVLYAGSCSEELRERRLFHLEIRPVAEEPEGRDGNCFIEREKVG